MPFLRLGDADVRAAASTSRVGPGAEVPGPAEGGREVLVRKVSGVLDVAEGAGPRVGHLPLGTAEELLHLRVL